MEGNPRNRAADQRLRVRRWHQGSKPSAVYPCARAFFLDLGGAAEDRHNRQGRSTVALAGVLAVHKEDLAR